MTTDQGELERRETLARAAIARSLGTEDGEYGATLFASHHLEEVDAAYWNERLGTETPDHVQVIGLLQLESHWADDDEEGIENLDFGLPGGVSDYLLSVSFGEDGEVEEISMES